MSEAEMVDVDELLDIRNWLIDAAEAKGANVQGSGIGLGKGAGAADFDFRLNGRRYWVEITEMVDNVEEEERDREFERGSAER